MRTMRYKLPLEEYIISNGDTEDGNVRKAPIKLIGKDGWNTECIEPNEELEGIYEQSLAGETDYVLTSISICSFSITLWFTNKYSLETDFLHLNESCVQQLAVEVDRGDSQKPDFYQIGFVPSGRNSEGEVINTVRISERQGSEKRVIIFTDDGADISETHC